MLALLVSMTLGACSKSGIRLVEKAPPPSVIKPIKVAIPDLSPAERKPCSDPGVPVGVDALETLAETRLVLGVCRARHQRVVKKYSDAQKL